MRTTRILAPALAALLVMAAPTAVGAAKKHSAKDATVTNPHDGTEIAITVFKPAGASASSPVPVILHSHGWSGSRATEIGGTVERLLDAGFGVVSIDQRGHGDSGGQAHVQDPTRETEDVKAVIDHVAGLGWVLHDTDRRGREIADDPVLGAIGGSYGGGYQTMTALDEIHEEGRTRFNALAPEITWFDLPESLAPQGVVRTAWTALLYAVGADMVPQHIHESFAWGTATGQWPDGTLYGEPVEGAPNLDRVFTRHSPAWYAKRGVRIDVPVLLRQGISDNLFNLNEGVHLFERTVTNKAWRQSYLVGYNGGHALPNILPAGTAAGDDACSGDFTRLTIRFFRRAFADRSTAGLLPARYNLTTADGSTCLGFNRLKKGKAVGVDPSGSGRMIATAGLGAPLHIPLKEGPVTVAGIPRLAGTVTAAGLDTRAFFGLSIGSTPADARVIQNNLLPLRRAQPVQDGKFRIELPGVAVEVPEGQSLFLTITPFSDLSFGHGSRTPGGFLLGNLRVKLPATKG